jgi:hypothetical protein
MSVEREPQREASYTGSLRVEAMTYD